MQYNGTFKFADSQNGMNRESVYSYDDSYFRSTSFALGPRLRTMSLCLAMAAFPCIGEGYDNQAKNVKKLLADIGFSDIAENSDYKRKPEAFSVGIVCGYRVVDEEDPMTIVAITFRGASYELEWYGNTIIDRNGPASGFLDSSNKVLVYLKEYLDRNQEHFRGPIKIWMTGYSRVAAISNLAGGILTGNADRFGLKDEDIYIYTFEAPKSIPKSDEKVYKNIHNTVCPFDMIPLIAPDSWGFKRYGFDDTLIPVPGEVKWDELIRKVRARLVDIAPDIAGNFEDFELYCMSGRRIVPVSDAKEKRGKRFKIQSCYASNQGAYLSDFIEFMGKRMANSAGVREQGEKINRDTYCKEYQESFALLAKSYLGSRQKLTIRKVFLDMIDRIKSPKNLPFFTFVMKMSGRWSVRNRATKRIQEIFNEVRDSGGKNTNTKEMIIFEKNLVPAVNYMLYCISCDIKENNLIYLATLVKNLPLILQAHRPEYILAWMYELEEWSRE